MSKLIYMAKAHSKFDSKKDEFVARWRLHGAKGMNISFMWRSALSYIQAETIYDKKLNGFQYDFDGIGVSKKDESKDADFNNLTPEQIQEVTALGEDEKETFGIPTSENAMFVDEIKIKDGILGGITAFLFFKDRDAAKMEAEKCKDIELARRVILNMKDSNQQQFSSEYDAVIEISAESFDDIKEIVKTSAKHTVEGSDYAVLTREAVLWNRF